MYLPAMTTCIVSAKVLGKLPFLRTESSPKQALLWNTSCQLFLLFGTSIATLQFPLRLVSCCLDLNKAGGFAGEVAQLNVRSQVKRPNKSHEENIIFKGEEWLSVPVKPASLHLSDILLPVRNTTAGDANETRRKPQPNTLVSSSVIRNSSRSYNFFFRFKVNSFCNR